MATENSIKDLYQTLKIYGIDKKFTKEILLPDWWEDEIADSQTGYFQAASIIAKNLGIDIAGLINKVEIINLKNPAQIKFKYPINLSFNQKDIWPNSLASKVSEIIEQLYDTPFKKISNDVLNIRSSILNQYKIVNLRNTLEFLWSSGIPVVHIPVFPKEINKMDGMAVNLDGRPIIILSKNRRHDAWLLFILAHELGHIIKGHLSNVDKIIYDVNLESEGDNEEKEANEFAIELLNGTKSPSYLSSSKVSQSSFELVNEIRPISKQFNIDPGVIALNYAYQTKNYPLVEQALKVLSPKANAVNLIKTIMTSKLDLGKLSEENYDYFAKLTSLNED
ncbi:MAG: ImmA/IrrE family metallo-endopeptidase [Ignavibacteriaceae bacterium]